MWFNALHSALAALTLKALRLASALPDPPQLQHIGWLARRHCLQVSDPARFVPRKPRIEDESPVRTKMDPRSFEVRSNATIVSNFLSHVYFCVYSDKRMVYGSKFVAKFVARMLLRVIHFRAR